MRIIGIILLCTICFLSLKGRYFIINILSERQLVVIFFRETVFRRYLLVYLAAWGWGNTAEACMKTLTLCKTKKFHFITLFNSQEAFFQFMTLVPFVSYTELSVLSKLTLSNKILKLLFPHLYDVHCQSYTPIFQPVWSRKKP